MLSFPVGLVLLAVALCLTSKFNFLPFIRSCCTGIQYDVRVYSFPTNANLLLHFTAALKWLELLMPSAMSWTASCCILLPIGSHFVQHHIHVNIMASCTIVGHKLIETSPCTLRIAWNLTTVTTRLPRRSSRVIRNVAI